MIVKVCGITTLHDGRMALDAGADWIGLNLVSGPRRIELPAALSILKGLAHPFRAVVLVNVTGDVPDESIFTALVSHGVQRLQLYGEVTPQAVATLCGGGFEIVFVQPVGEEQSLKALDAFLADCGSTAPQFVLFDSAVKGRAGGTGQKADWEAIARARELDRFADWPAVILAGGLTPENVAEAISRTMPAGVDVSSGVESAPGRKNREKIKRFVAAVRD